jgi:hypothetical protein
MKTNRNLLAVVTGLVCCGVVVWFCTSIQGVEKSYEVQPQITVPEYRTDAARAIDAYERLMERYMDVVESNLTRIGSDTQRIVEKLDSIDVKLTKLCSRIARIEKALGLEQSERPVTKKPPSAEAEEKIGYSTEPQVE